MRLRARHLVAASASLCLTGTAEAFGLPPPEALPPVLHDTTALSHALYYSSTNLAAASNVAVDILQAYKSELQTNPLQTKMLTGAIVALIGDAIAQSREFDLPYNRRRAVSFMTFDACYRWLQHTVYPPMIDHLQGQYIGALVSAIPPLAHAMTTAQSYGSDPTHFFSVMEQTLSSQLGIVPFIYYPVFYTITGFLQQLTPAQTLQRAKDTFVPLMKRNLLFWIPVQFVQFGFVEEDLQIPFVTVCGLVWTVILSVMAGAAQTNEKASEKSREMASHYCITGAEDHCEIDPDDLFPHVLEDAREDGSEDVVRFGNKVTVEEKEEKLLVK